MAAAITCTQCGAACAVPTDDGWIRTACPVCKESFRVYPFPALFRPLLKKPRRQNAAVGEASCYFHASKRASVPCDGCGRFLCSLCDLEFSGRHFCAACLGNARKGRPGTAPEAEDLMREKVFLPHNLAWALACYSPLTLVGLYLIPVTAPAAFWFAVKHWRRPDGLQIRGRWRAIGALILVLLQLAGLAFIAFGVVLILRESAKK